MPYGLGLERTANRLAAPNPLWGRAFEEEAARIRAAAGPDVLAIEHYGSTSVPGLCAKPIIDLLVGVADLSLADRHAPRRRRVDEAGARHQGRAQAQPIQAESASCPASGILTHGCPGAPAGWAPA